MRLKSVPGLHRTELRRALQSMNTLLKRLKRPVQIYRFTGTGDKSWITVPAYVPGSSYVVVNGQAVRIPGIHYNEIQDAKGYYTIIQDNGSHAAPVFPKDRYCDFIYTPIEL